MAKTQTETRKNKKKQPPIFAPPVELEEEEPELELEEEEEEEEEENEPQTEEEEVQHSVREAQLKNASFDIFNEMDKNRKKGIPCYVELHRGGAWLAKIDDPFSWAQVSKLYGGGQYQARLKASIGHQIMRSQSQMIEGEAITPPRIGSQPQAPAPQSDSQAFTTRDLLAVMDDRDRKAKEEAREAAKSQENSSNMMLTMMIKMMEMSQKAQADSMAALVTRLADNQTAMFQQMQTQIQMLSQKPSKPEIGILELMAMLDRKGSKEVENFKQLQEMAEMKAEEKAELLAQIESAKGGGEKESLTDKVIGAVAPLLAAGAANIKAAQTQPVPQAPPPTMVGTPITAKPIPASAAKPIVAQSRPLNPQPQPVRKVDPVNPLKQKIESILFPKLQGWLLSMTEASVAAKEAETLLLAQKIPVSTATREFSSVELVGMAKQNGFGQDIQNWLKSFHAELSKLQASAPVSKSDVDSVGKSAS